MDGKRKWEMKWARPIVWPMTFPEMMGQSDNVPRVPTA